jgi:predicted ester cyclase
MLIRHFVDEVVNRKKLDAIDRVVADGFVEHVPFPGKDGLKYAIGLFVNAFPDFQWTMDDQVAEGSKVVSRFTWTGTHRGPFLGIRPTGRRVRVWVVIELVRGGNPAESRVIMDILALMQQLGATSAG